MRALIILLLLLVACPVYAQDNDKLPEKYFRTWDPLSRGLNNYKLKINSAGKITEFSDSKNSYSGQYRYIFSDKKFDYILYYPDKKNDGSPEFWKLKYETEDFPVSKETEITVGRYICQTNISRNDFIHHTQRDLKTLYYKEECDKYGNDYDAHTLFIKY